MTTKKFTFLQMIAVVDGRVTTNVDDVQSILSHLLGRSVLTHEIPGALRYLREQKPLWYVIMDDTIRILNAIHNYDFNKIIVDVKENYNPTFEIPSLQ